MTGKSKLENGTGSSTKVDTRAFEKKFSSLRDTAEDIQSVSRWCIQIKGHHSTLIHAWLRALKKAKVSHRLTLFYVCNDIIQNAKRKKIPALVQQFFSAVKEGTPLVREEKIRAKIVRIFSIWEERGVYDQKMIAELTAALKPSESISTSDSDVALANFQPNQLVESLRTVLALENTSASLLGDLNSQDCTLSDAELDTLRNSVKERNPNLDRVTEFEEAMTSLECYLSTMQKQIDERTKLIGLMEQAESYYEAQRGEAKLVVHAYKSFHGRVKSLKVKLTEKLKKLPDEDGSPLLEPPSPSTVPSPLPSPDEGSSPQSEDELNASRDTRQYSCTRFAARRPCLHSSSLSSKPTSSSGMSKEYSGSSSKEYSASHKEYPGSSSGKEYSGSTTSKEYLSSSGSKEYSGSSGSKEYSGSSGSKEYSGSSGSKEYSGSSGSKEYSGSSGSKEYSSSSGSKEYSGSSGSKEYSGSSGKEYSSSSGKEYSSSSGKEYSSSSSKEYLSSSKDYSRSYSSREYGREHSKDYHRSSTALRERSNSSTAVRERSSSSTSGEKEHSNGTQGTSSSRDHSLSSSVREHISATSRDHASGSSRDHTSGSLRDLVSGSSRDHSSTGSRDYISSNSRDHTTASSRDQNSSSSRDQTSGSSRDQNSSSLRDHSSRDHGSSRDHSSLRERSSSRDETRSSSSSSHYEKETRHADVVGGLSKTEQLLLTVRAPNQDGAQDLRPCQQEFKPMSAAELLDAFGKELGLQGRAQVDPTDHLHLGSPTAKDSSVPPTVVPLPVPPPVCPPPSLSTIPIPPTPPVVNAPRSLPTLSTTSQSLPLPPGPLPSTLPPPVLSLNLPSSAPPPPSLSSYLPSSLPPSAPPLPSDPPPGAKDLISPYNARKVWGVPPPPPPLPPPPPPPPNISLYGDAPIDTQAPSYWSQSSLDSSSWSFDDLEPATEEHDNINWGEPPGNEELAAQGVFFNEPCPDNSSDNHNRLNNTNPKVPPTASNLRVIPTMQTTDPTPPRSSSPAKQETDRSSSVEDYHCYDYRSLSEATTTSTASKNPPNAARHRNASGSDMDISGSEDERERLDRKRCVKRPASADISDEPSMKREKKVESDDDSSDDSSSSSSSPSFVEKNTTFEDSGSHPRNLPEGEHKAESNIFVIDTITSSLPPVHPQVADSNEISDVYDRLDNDAGVASDSTNTDDLYGDLDGDKREPVIDVPNFNNITNAIKILISGERRKSEIPETQTTSTPSVSVSVDNDMFSGPGNRQSDLRDSLSFGAAPSVPNGRPPVAKSMSGKHNLALRLGSPVRCLSSNDAADASASLLGPPPKDLPPLDPNPMKGGAPTHPPPPVHSRPSLPPAQQRPFFSPRPSGPFVNTFHARTPQPMMRSPVGGIPPFRMRGSPGQNWQQRGNFRGRGGGGRGRDGGGGGRGGGGSGGRGFSGRGWRGRGHPW
ncbi:RNA polymerase II-binding domain [Trinorchestia longiramus]|nr:RNA polymerase II-binding domain [Trinorchestia longiramus]